MYCPCYYYYFYYYDYYYYYSLLGLSTKIVKLNNKYCLYSHSASIRALTLVGAFQNIIVSLLYIYYNNRTACVRNSACEIQREQLLRLPKSTNIMYTFQYVQIRILYLEYLLYLLYFIHLTVVPVLFLLHATVFFIFLHIYLQLRFVMNETVTFIAVRGNW